MAQLFYLFVVCVCFRFANAQFGFFPNQREDRRYVNMQGFQNFVSYPKQMNQRMNKFLHLQPNGKLQYIYPYSDQPANNNVQYDQYGRPISFYQNYQNPRQYGYQNNYPYYNQYNREINRNYQNPTVNEYPNFNFDNNNNKQPEEIVTIIENKDDQNNGDDARTTSPQVPDNNQPSTPPPSATTEATPVEEQARYDDDPSPPTSELPPVWPPGKERQTELPELTPVPFQQSTPLPELTTVPHLPELTPVPGFENRNIDSPFKETCQTVNGGYGTCLSILSCEPYVKLLHEAKSINNPVVVDTLRRAHCGFEGSNPKVCCPRWGFATALPTANPTPHQTTNPTPRQTPPPTTPGIAMPDEVTTTTESPQHTFLQPPVCGTSNATLSRVVGGVPAKLGDFPWMALLGYKNRQGTAWNCGGSLVSNKHVLTAAHCIHGHEQMLYVVRLGELDTARDDDGATPIDILIERKIVNELYDPQAFTNDIALLLLQKPVTFTAMIRPICLPFPEEIRKNTFENYNPLIAGWGAIEFRGVSATRLQVLQLPVVSNEFCREAYSAYKAQKIDERVLCAGYKQGGKDACQGDSGGPLMQPIWNSETLSTYFYQIGVVSFGKRCAEAGFPGVYSRVTHFTPWLQKTMAANP